MSTRSNKSIVLAIVICIIAGFGIGFGGSKLFSLIKGPSDGEYTITVCSTTDIHGSYFDRDFDGTPFENSMSDISSYLKEIRAQGIDPVLIDCGDNLQGSNAAYFYNYVDTAETHIFTEIQQYLGYDALVVGNHDIETSHKVYDRVRKEAGIPMLAANAIKTEGENKGAAYFDEYTIVKRGKIKIAVIGMTNPNIKSWLAEPVYEGMDFVTIRSIAQELVNKVNEKEKPHLTILAVHSGSGVADSPVIEDEAQYLACNINGINLVLCGHDHKATCAFVPGGNENILVSNSGTKSNNISRIDFTLTIKGNKTVSAIPTSYGLISMDQYSPDPEYQEKFSSHFETVKEFANRPICRLNKEISFEETLGGPSEYLTLLHRTQLFTTGADISFAAPLTSKGKVNAGEITFNSLAKIYRFENTLYKIEMTGRQIKDFLEYSYDTWINKSAPQYNFDSAAGIEYTVSIGKKKGERVNIISLSNGKEFEEEGRYSVALTSYRASGGGNLLTDGAGMNPQENIVLGQYQDIRSLIGKYMSSFPEGYEPQVENNWKFVD